MILEQIKTNADWLASVVTILTFLSAIAIFFWRKVIRLIIDKLSVLFRKPCGVTSEFLEEQQAATAGTRVCYYSKNNGLILIGSGDQQFGIKFSKASNEYIHVYSDHATIEFVGKATGVSAGTMIDGNGVDHSSRSYTLGLGDHFFAKNKRGYFMQARIKSIKDDTRGDNEDEVVFEYQINVSKRSMFNAL